MGDQLPHDLLLNILSRLPVQSLLCFQCVCKSWYSIISHDDYFCHLHRLHHSNYPTMLSCTRTRVINDDEDDDDDDDLHRFTTVSRRRVRFFHFNEGDDWLNLLKMMSVDAEDERDRKVKVTALSTYDPLSLSLVSHRLLRFPSVHNPQQNHTFLAKSKIISSCHGVLCLGVDTEDGQHSLYLYNPSIRKFNYVISYPKTKRYLVGFGFAPLDNDYRIVMVCMDTPEPVRVYSLNNTTTPWSILPTAPVGVQPLEPAKSATYLNGKCHWLAHIPNDRDDHYDIELPPDESIWYFDLDSCKFGHFMQPNPGDPIQLMVYKDMLTYHFHKDYKWHMWVMEEYGVAESWAPLITLDYYEFPLEYRFCTEHVVEMDVNSKILLHAHKCPTDDPIVRLPSDGGDEIELGWADGRTYNAALILCDPLNNTLGFHRLINYRCHFVLSQQSLVLLRQNPPTPQLQTYA